MSIQPTDMNPIRFYSTGNAIDRDDYWPNDHNMIQRVEYFPGEYAQAFYPVHLVNKEIQMQFKISGIGSLTMTVYLPNGTTTTITPTNINPVGWTGTDVWLYTYTPSVKGVYYFTISTFTSDKLYVISEDKFKKQIVQIEYYNTENTLGTVFFDETTQVFTPVAYLDGILKGGAPKNNKSGFMTDQEMYSTQRSAPVPTATLQIMTHRTLLQQLNMIFGCDRITINNITYQTADELEVDQTEKEDIYTVTVNLLETNYNNYRKTI